MYLADDYFRRHGVREQARVMFVSAGTTVFAIQKYRATLERIVRERDIETHFHHNLVEIRGETKEAVFELMDSNETVTIPYEMIHVTPPMSAPDFIRESPLADEKGWVDVDRLTLQHVKYSNVFALGDASNLPTSRTGAAVRKQAPVLVQNLVSAMKGEPLTAAYNGYSSCPIITRHGRVMLAEFDYDLQPHETFPFDQAKERWSMWLLKKYGLSLMYWHGMLKGRM
jgi:sulfide:quinone oxidoreductase